MHITSCSSTLQPQKARPPRTAYTAFRLLLSKALCTNRETTMIFELIAIFCCGTFFGAAVYISLAQHPATLEAGVAVGGRFFPPMYNHAAPMQITLAATGFLAGLVAWYLSSSILWLLGALLLILVVPITLIIIKPINDILLNPENDPDSTETAALLKQWGSKHWLRTIVSGVAFIIYLVAALNA